MNPVKSRRMDKISLCTLPFLAIIVIVLATSAYTLVQELRLYGNCILFDHQLVTFE